VNSIGPARSPLSRQLHQDFIRDDGVMRVDRAGDVGQDLIAGFDIGGLPHWRWNASATYNQGAFTGTLSGRFVDGGKYDHTYGPFDIDDNHISSRFYLNASMQYRLNHNGRSSCRSVRWW